MQKKPMICMTAQEYAELMRKVRVAEKIIKESSFRNCGELIDYWYAKHFDSSKNNEVEI